MQVAWTHGRPAPALQVRVAQGASGRCVPPCKMFHDAHHVVSVSAAARPLRHIVRGRDLSQANGASFAALCLGRASPLDTICWPTSPISCFRPRFMDGVFTRAHHRQVAARRPR
eukprot:7634184-Alexandrium_andersonii.AAC.1